MIKLACITGLLAVFAGCGGGRFSTADPGTAPPHGGQLINLPGGKGYVEVVQKDPAPGNALISREVSFYFLKDMNTPISTPPTTGTLATGKKQVALKPEDGALVTPSGPPLFPRGDLDGSLSLEIDGKPVNIPLGVR